MCPGYNLLLVDHQVYTMFAYKACQELMKKTYHGDRAPARRPHLTPRLLPLTTSKCRRLPLPHQGPLINNHKPSQITFIDRPEVSASMHPKVHTAHYTVKVLPGLVQVSADETGLPEDCIRVWLRRATSLSGRLDRF